MTRANQAMAGVKALTAQAAISKLCVSGLPPLQLFEQVARRLRQVVPYSAGCWKPIDPASMLFTGFAIEDSQPGTIRSVQWRFVDNELLQPDVAKFRDLARLPRPVITLHQATHGEPERSARYRDLHQALGFGAELRAVFRSGGACWGSVALLRGGGQPDFSREEIGFVARICADVGLGLRLALLTDAAHAGATATAPGMVVLREDLSCESLTPQAARWVEQIPADYG